MATIRATSPTRRSSTNPDGDFRQCYERRLNAELRRLPDGHAMGAATAPAIVHFDAIESPAAEGKETAAWYRHPIVAVAAVILVLMAVAGVIWFCVVNFWHKADGEGKAATGMGGGGSEGTGIVFNGSQGVASTSALMPATTTTTMLSVSRTSSTNTSTDSIASSTSTTAMELTSTSTQTFKTTWTLAYAPSMLFSYNTIVEPTVSKSPNA